MSKTAKPGHENTTQMSKMLPASNIYRVGDYVFVETQPSHPYQIRRIEELTKTSNGQVEAKVSCFYRRRDLSNALQSQADKHASSAEEEGEINYGTDVTTDEENHQLKHREVFLSRQLEIINANTIRGKCSVTLYSEVELLLDYIKEDDWFYYLLVYDPQQKTLLADRGEIGVGEEYQADRVGDTVVELAPDDPNKENPDYDPLAWDPLKGIPEKETYRTEALETLQWDPQNCLNEKKVDQFLVMARSIGTFARALDSGSSSKEPSLHLSAAAASRDITLFQALNILHKSDYDIGKAVSGLIPDGGPVLCRDEMEEWSSGEATLFEEGIRKHGKEFLEIQQEYLPWKSLSSIIEYYYMWKTTDKYVQQKRMKAQEGDSKVTQIFIPSSNTAINLTLAIQTTSQYQVTPTGTLVSPNYMCESCFNKESVLWYPWGPTTSQCKLYLCKDCWVYWKKCGGLKKSQRSSESNSGDGKEACYKCRICNKKFNRAERLSSHMLTHRGYNCSESGCGKTFNLKTHLTRHLAKAHCIYPLDSKMKVKTPFTMSPTPLMKAARYLCKEKLRLSHFARTPTDCIDQAEIKTEAEKQVTVEKAKGIIDQSRTYKCKSLEEVVEHVKKLPKSSNLKLNVNFGGSENHSNERFSPSGRANGSPFQQVPTSITQNLKNKTMKSPTPIMAGSKRDAERPQQSHEQNEPPMKRQQPMPGSSPLGRKGYECTYCGKILHNQMSLQHHIQMNHSNQTSGGGPQIHIPQTDGHKRQYQQQQQQHYHDMPPPGSHHQYPSHHSNSGYHHKDGLPNGNMPPISHSKTSSRPPSGATSRKQSYKVIVKQQRRDDNMQYVDPPPEFLFNATKDSKKSRRSLPSRVQRKIARKPFVQIKCSQELSDAIMCKKADSKVKSADPILIADD